MHVGRAGRAQRQEGGPLPAVPRFHVRCCQTKGGRDPCGRVPDPGQATEALAKENTVRAALSRLCSFRGQRLHTHAPKLLACQCIMDRDSGYASLITYQLMCSAPALSAFVSGSGYRAHCRPCGFNCDPGWVRNTVAQLASRFPACQVKVCSC